MEKRRKLRKKFFSVEELNAYRSAYEKPLGKLDYLKFIFIPALLSGLFLGGLIYNIPLFILGFVIGLRYGIKTILPNTVMRQYEIKSLHQRNHFLTILTQVAQDANKTSKELLERVNDRLEGELKKEMKVLEATLVVNETEEGLNAVFNFF